MYGSEPSYEIIAKHFGFTIYEVSNALDSLKEPVSIYEPTYSDGGEDIYLLDQLQDKHEDNAYEAEQESAQRKFHVAADKGFGDDMVNAVDNPFPYKEDSQSDGYFYGSAQDSTDGLFEKLVERQARKRR